MRFDGTGDYIDTGRFASEFSIDGSKPKTASIWAYVEYMWNRGGPFNVGTCALNEQFGFRTFSASPDTWRAQFWGGDINFGKPSMNAWVHLAVAYDGTSAHIYADGVEVASAAVALNTTGGNPMRIGVYIQGTTFYSFQGVLDEMQLSNTYRSSDWIRLDYETQKAGQTIVVVGP
jgi:hypothetical protein